MKQCDRCNALYPPRYDSCPFCDAASEQTAPKSWIRTRNPRDTVKMSKDPPTAEMEDETSDAIHATLEEMMIQDDTVEIGKRLLKEHSAAILAAAGLAEDSVPSGEVSSEAFEDRVPTAKVHYLDDDELEDGVIEDDVSSVAFPPGPDDVPTPQPDDLVGEIADQLHDGGLFDSVFDSLELTTDDVATDPPTSEVLLDEADDETSAPPRAAVPPPLPSSAKAIEVADSVEALPVSHHTLDDYDVASTIEAMEKRAEALRLLEEQREQEKQAVPVDVPAEPRRRHVAWGAWLVQLAGLAVVGVAGWTFATGLPLWLTITVAASGLIIATVGRR